MKRHTCAARTLAALLAALVLLAAAPFATAAPALDLNVLSLEELYGLRQQIDAQIAALESATGAVLYESGGYRVGTDIPAGDYALYENSDAVFASAVVRAGDSEEPELVTYHLINGQAVIRLVPDTWLTLSEATAVPISQAEAVSDGFAGEGGYLVGVTLPAGTYTAVPLEKAPLSSYSVYSGILGSSAQLLKFEVLHEATPITLAEGEYIELSGCGLESAFGGEEG